MSPHHELRVFVIGGSGFIGTNLVKTLLETNCYVTIFDKEISPKFSELTIVGDVREINELTSAMANHDVIINLAAEHRDDVQPKSLYHEVNVMGMNNILQAAETNNIHRIIFTSTVAVYPLNHDKPDEDSVPEPFNEYGKSKLEAEKLLSTWAEKPSNHALIIRPTVVIGKGNRGNVYNLIKQIQTGYFLMIGDGTNKKSMCHVNNLVSFIQVKLSLKRTELYNFVDKPDLTTSEIISIIRSGLKQTRALKTYFKIPYSIGLLGGAFFDLISALTGKSFAVSRIRVKKFTATTIVCSKRLDNSHFVPNYSLEEGLRSMIID